MTTRAPVQQQYGGGLTFYDPTYEVWHQDDEGDLCLACFDVQVPTGYSRWWYVDDEGTQRLTRDGEKKLFDWRDGPVKAEYQRAIKNWAVMKMREDGEVPTTAPTLCPGVFMCPQPDMQDYRRFYFVAKFKKTVPERLPLDSIAMLAEEGHIDNEAMMRGFLQQMQGFREGVVDVAHMEAQAQDSKTLAKRAEIEARETKRVDYLLTHRVTR